MGQQLRVPGKQGGNRHNRNGIISEIVTRPYLPDQDFAAVLVLFDRYIKEVEGKDFNRFLDTSVGRINMLEGRLLEYRLEDKASIMVAEHIDRPIGFMIYHLIFEHILIVRGIYFEPEYRNAMLLRKMGYSASPKIKKVYSQTLKAREPKDIAGEKKYRKKIGETEEHIIWENILIRERKNA